MLQSSEEMYRNVQGSQIKSQKVVLNQLDDLVQHMGAATTKNANLDGEALDYLTTSFTRANDNIKKSSRQLDSILENPIFQQGIFKEGGLQIDYLRGIKKDLDKNLDSGKKDIIALSKKIEEFTKIKGTRGDRPSLSFSQMYELREAIETL